MDRTRWPAAALRIARSWIRGTAARLASNDLDIAPSVPDRRTYTRGEATRDLSAAVNVALLSFPQGMAYALLAGLPVSLGVMTAGIAAIVGPLFSRSRYLVHGPTNATAVMLLGTAAATGINPRELSTLVLLVGWMLLAAALLQLDALIKYVSRTVVIGYLTAAAVLIVVNQMHHAFGVHAGRAESAAEVLVDLFRRLPGTSVSALIITAVSVLAWFPLSRRVPRLPRVVLTLVVASLVTAVLPWIGLPAPRCLTPMPLGSLAGHLPAFNPDAIYRGVAPAFAVALLVVLETTALARAAAARSGQRVNVNQELLATGFANTACAFFPAMAASVSPTRTALNRDSGAVTRYASMFGGVLVLLAMVCLQPLLHHVPVAALAVVVMFTATGLIDPAQLRTVFRSTRSDAIVLVLTIVTALLAPLSVAVYLGVAASLVLYLRKAGQPELVEFTFDEQGQLRAAGPAAARPDPQVSIIHVEGELFFGASDLFEEQIRRVCADPQIHVVILRMKNARHLDATCVLALEELLRFLHETKRHLIISGATVEVRRVLHQSGFLAHLGEENFFLTLDDNPNLSTRHALQRARALLGGARADVRIFHPSRPEPGPVDTWEI